MRREQRSLKEFEGPVSPASNVGISKQLIGSVEREFRTASVLRNAAELSGNGSTQSFDALQSPPELAQRIIVRNTHSRFRRRPKSPLRKKWKIGKFGTVEDRAECDVSVSVRAPPFWFPTLEFQTTYLYCKSGSATLRSSPGTTSALKVRRAG